MGFGLNLNAGGDFLPIIKYDARAGRFFRVDRNDEGEREPIDITDGLEFLPDFEHAEKGWAYFQPGQAPDFLMVSVESKDLPPQPSKNHRKAVRLRLMLSPKTAGGAERLREITTTANAALHGFETLYEEWLANRDRNPDKVVMARLTGVKPVTSGGRQKSTNYEPQFTIVNWVKAPEEFETPPERSAPTPNGSASPDDYRAAKSGSANPPAVPAKSPPPRPADEDTDWG
ncbi:MAG: hypothetical protein K0Q60_1808 [Microvirga sp.]|nr:hypothetical protein [Microvirga sp.]